MNIQDSIDAARDAILLRAGVLKSASHAHPRAAELSNTAILPGLAKLLGGNATRHAQITEAQAFGAGLSTSDFQKTLADAMRSTTVRRLKAHTKHRGFCDPRPMRNFTEHTFPSLDADVALLENPELSEHSAEVAVTETGGLTARIRTFGRNVYVSRQVLRNDDIELIAALFSNAGAGAGRLEASLVYGLLESNPTLDDSESLFHVDHGNIEASALSEDALGAAMGRLRKMPTPAGAPADLSAAFLVVSPELELLALRLLKAAGLETVVEVVASPWLATGRWYLLASPSQAPVVGLLHLGASDSGVIVGPIKEKEKWQGRDGLLFGVRFDVGVVPVGRVGAVRGGV